MQEYSVVVFDMKNGVSLHTAKGPKIDSEYFPGKEIMQYVKKTINGNFEFGQLDYYARNRKMKDILIVDEDGFCKGLPENIICQNFLAKTFEGLDDTVPLNVAGSVVYVTLTKTIDELKQMI
jgi:hypothetical protein